MAVVMLAGNTGLSAFTTAFAATKLGPYGTDVTVTFPESTDPQATSIVTGGGVKLNLDVPSGYVPQDDSAKGLKMFYNGQTDVSDGKGLEISGDGKARNVNVTKDFFNLNTGILGGNTDLANISISGSFAGLLQSGNMTEQAVQYTENAGTPSKPTMTMQPPTLGSFSVSPSQTIYKTSTIVLECTASETARNAPQFEIKTQPGSDTQFSKYTIATARRRNSDSAELLVTMGGAGQANVPEFRLSFTPNSTYTTSSVDGKPFDTGPNQWIQKGAKFTFTFPEPRSNSIMLTIYSPKAAVQDLQKDYEQFLHLAQGDTKNFITKDFKVNYSAKRFNSDFTIKWEWDPEDKGQPAHKDVVYFGEYPNGLRDVIVRPLYNDVKGNIIMTITYDRDPENAVVKQLPPVKIPVTIRGTGQLPSVEQESQWITTEDPGTGNRTVKEEAIPTPSPMHGTTTHLNAYDGMVKGTKIPKEPHRYKIQLNMGKDNGMAQYAVVKAIHGDGSIVSMQTEINGVASDYVLESQIENPNKDRPSNEAQIFLTFTPNKTGVRTEQTVRFEINFYSLDGNNQPVLNESSTSSFYLKIKDESPSSDATLSALVVKAKDSKGGILGTSMWKNLEQEGYFTFRPEQTDYEIKLPYQYEALQFSPKKNSQYGIQDIKVKAQYSDGTYPKGWEPTDSGDPNSAYRTFKSGSTTDNIPKETVLEVNKQIKIELMVTAEDTTTKTYLFNVMREPKGTDSTLKSLTLTDPDGNVLFDGLVPNQFEYTVEIPFNIPRVKVGYEHNDPNAPKIDPQEGFDPDLIKIGMFDEYEWLDLLAGYKAQDPDSQRRMTFMVTSRAQDDDKRNDSTYIIHIQRAEPSTVNTLADLQVIDGSSTEDVPLTIKPAFAPGMEMVPGDSFELNTAYSVNKVKISAKPTYEGATVILLAPGMKAGGILGDTDTGGEGWAKLSSKGPSKPFTPTIFHENEPDKYYTATVEVWPESMIPLKGTARPQKPGDVITQEGNVVTYEEYLAQVMRYPVNIYREAPSMDSTLSSVAFADQDGGAINFLDFAPDLYSYNIDVPFEVEKITVTPTATFEHVARIEVNGRKVESGEKSNLIKLEDTTTTITVKVFPEAYLEDTNIQPTTYTFHFRRAAPSSDARLLKLEVENAVDFSPVFAPSRYNYTAKVTEGAEGVKITATPNHKGAKISIDGVRVENGKPSELIHILEINQTVKIEVVAQDGKTKLTYTIRFTNENLIEKTDNADLERLRVEPGSMRPERFKPSVTEYSIYVPEDVWDVQLIPRTADDYATVEVFLDGREIGDDDNNYAATIQDGENEFTIDVTSSDQSKKKTYTVTVYRNDEENMGNLKPLHAENIDFEGSGVLIQVDVTKYPRIARDVFEELKKWPDKTIIFQGNGYSISFKASDLERIIPSTEYYDFSMSFRSPQREDIRDEIYSYPKNEDVRFVTLYFNYHGELPGKAILTVDLEDRYANDTYFWNYYNEPYFRLDYYGQVKTNSKGVFSVPLSHMSTYVLSSRMLRGAENMSGSSGNVDLSGQASSNGNKVIPNTGVEGTTANKPLPNTGR